MKFSDIVDRTYGNVDPSWWNSLRDAGKNVEAILGSLFASETQFTVANNQSSAADVTSLAFAGAAVRSFEANVQIYRNSTSAGATELSARCRLVGIYKTVAASWEMTVAYAAGDVIDGFGPGGLLFSITAAGQVQYTSHNMSGTAATSKLKFNYTTMGVET